RPLIKDETNVMSSPGRIFSFSSFARLLPDAPIEVEFFQASRRRRAPLGATTGAPASRHYVFAPGLTEAPCRRPALRHSFCPLVRAGLRRKSGAQYSGWTA